MQTQTRMGLHGVRFLVESGLGRGTVLVQEPAGQWVFQIYDTGTGAPTTNESCWYCDCRQYYVDNPQAISSVTGCKVPTFG